MRHALLLAVALVVTPAAAAQACDGAARLAETAPTVRAIAARDASAADWLDRYACALAEATSPESLAVVVTLRDSVVAHVGPLVEPWFDESGATAAEDWRMSFDAMFAETEGLALRPIQSEGVLFGLTTAAFAPELRALAPPDLGLHIDALTAVGGTMGGEYPFASLDAEVDLIRASEALRARFPASPYVAATQEAFGRALLDLASLHPVAGDEFEAIWYAAVATTDPYPWEGDREALERFVAEAAESRYHAPLARILADPPLAASEGELTVLVAARSFSLESAQALALAWLDSGVDVVGVLPLRDRLAVVYRYAPSGDARLAAFERSARELGLTVDRVEIDVAELWGR